MKNKKLSNREIALIAIAHLLFGLSLGAVVLVVIGILEGPPSCVTASRPIFVFIRLFAYLFIILVVYRTLRMVRSGS